MSSVRWTRSRRVAIVGLAVVAAVVTGGCTAQSSSSSGPGSSSAAPSTAAPAAVDWASLEQRFGSRIGVVALDTETGAMIGNRADERFPMLSTFKVLAVAALLRAHPLRTGYFDQVVRFTAADIVSNSPVTSTRIDTGMTVADLARAALQYSDNTAGNLLLDRLGGPDALTAFARSIGDPVTRLDRREPELNTAIPDDPRDTSTPAAQAENLRTLLLGVPDPTVAPTRPEREQLTDWMIQNTTGAAKIRAALPGWTVADKTGGGDHGSANDVAVAWPPGGGAAIVVAVMTIRPADSTLDADPNLIAEVTRTAVGALRPPAG
ncbi:class A beta-lactamase [Williamsia phyllosphaerae]|uniref:Beta-lactamase n=1 Tax=Williamsia phyllosphaerae TaxID=885042 RepID=A0ABQ1UCQ0_9NOCA|nr:class A beta-lactamase [Williamsia phyllosphaerae]GGF14629.1 beta-lactamase [Williamsia phyllosphaerae]